MKPTNCIVTTNPHVTAKKIIRPNVNTGAISGPGSGSGLDLYTYCFVLHNGHSIKPVTARLHNSS